MEAKKLPQGTILVPFKDAKYPIHYDGQLWNVVWRSGKTGRMNIELPSGKRQIQQLEPTEVYHLAIIQESYAHLSTPRQITDKEIDSQAQEILSAANVDELPEELQNKLIELWTQGAKWMRDHPTEREGWISVEDRLPEKNGEDPIDCEMKQDQDEDIIDGYYDEDMWWIKLGGMNVGHRDCVSLDVVITEWRPKPPQG